MGAQRRLGSGARGVSGTLVLLAVLGGARVAEASLIVLGTDENVPNGHVRGYRAADLNPEHSFFAYPGFNGSVRVAAGDVTGDGRADLITGSGPGAPGGHVKVFDGLSGTTVGSFFTFEGFAGGVYVATGDVNGDGRADVFSGAGSGAVGGHVKVFDGAGPNLLHSFLAYPGFSGGVRVAAGDVTGDGRADIITGTGSGTPGQVKVFDGVTGALAQSYFAFGTGFTGGIFVAAGDVNGDGRTDVITGADSGAPSGHVKVFDGATQGELHSFFAFDTGFGGGVRVGAVDRNGDGRDDILAVQGPGGTTQFKIFNGASGALLDNFLPYGSISQGAFVSGVPVPEPAAGLALGSALMAFVLRPSRGHVRRRAARRAFAAPERPCAR